MSTYFALTTALLTLLSFGSVSVNSQYPSSDAGVQTLQNLNDLKFLGPLKTRDEGEGSLYFTSQSNTSWTDARNLCREVLGNDASLVNIETEDELTEINDLLVAAGDRMTSFWTGGKYEENGRKVFSWGNSELVGDFVWAADEPSRLSSGTSAVMKKNPNGEWEAYSRPQTDKHGLICELVPGSSEIPNPCYNTNDLIIILDSSGSIEPNDYWLAKSEFVVNVTDAWNGWEETRQEFLIYSENVETIYDLNNTLNDFQIEEKVLGARHIQSGTASDLALQKSYMDFQMFYRNVTRNVVFLTDGKSNEPPKTKEQAQNLHRAGVRVFSIGIGTGINEQELIDIASYPAYVFYVHEFAFLKSLLKPITELVCEP